MLTSQDIRFSVAPMMDWTDRHCRFFHRLMTRRARLYTEMLTLGAVIHGDRRRLLGFSPEEHPLALQLGGSHAADLAEAASIAVDLGYAEINLNVGCPSDRVQGGHFGACLMQEPDLVAQCVAAIKAKVSVPVTVKCRIGVDDQDPQVALYAMVGAVEAAGVDAVIVHARKAWLKGLSPKQNREVPPLDHDLVYRLKQDFARLPISLNGGIVSLDQAADHLAFVDGAMLGRAAYQDPSILLKTDSAMFGEPDPFTDAPAVVAALEPYVTRHISGGGRLHDVTRHMLGLFNGLPGARAWRRHLATEGVKADADFGTIRDALNYLRRLPERNEEQSAA